MVPSSGVVSDVFGELGETAKQAGKQAGQLPGDLLKTAGQQLKSGSVSGAQDHVNGGGEEGVSTVSKPALSQLDDQLTSQQELEVKAREERERSMARYRQILAELQQYRQQKAQEIPAYVAGKAGTPRTEEEKLELWEKEQREAEKQKKEAVVKLPGQQGGTKGVGERLQGVIG